MSYSNGNSFEEILQRVLNNDLLIDLDKREGSVIYDTLAPLCLELAEAYVQMDIMEEQTYLLTATGENLDKKAYDYGIVRENATNALVVGTFKKYKVDENGSYVYVKNSKNEDEKVEVDMEIVEGMKFLIPNTELIYTYIGDKEGKHILKCETVGTDGNQTNRKLISTTPISNLAEAKITTVYVPGEDAETDTELRTRVRSLLTDTAFGGNIADYIEKVGQIDGVGNLKVFPAWNLNGSVLLSVVDSSYNPITDDFASYLKEQIDPEEFTGSGVGMAPIGHHVTITTPQEYNVDVFVTVKTDSNVEIESIKEDILDVISDYFNNVRRKFSQYEDLSIYQAKIISEIFNKVEGIVNVESVLLNGVQADVHFEDSGAIKGQYLPKLGEVTIV